MPDVGVRDAESCVYLPPNLDGLALGRLRARLSNENLHVCKEDMTLGMCVCIHASVHAQVVSPCFARPHELLVELLEGIRCLLDRYMLYFTL